MNSLYARAWYSKALAFLNLKNQIGAEKNFACDTFLPEFKRNDLLLLCSDGLSNTLSDTDILDIVKSKKNLADIGKELLDMALSRGAPDNVTVGLLRK